MKKINFIQQKWHTFLSTFHASCALSLKSRSMFNMQPGTNMGAKLWDEQSGWPAYPLHPTNWSLQIQTILVDGNLTCSWRFGWAEYLPDKPLKGLACSNVPWCLAWADSAELATELHGNKQWD